MAELSEYTTRINELKERVELAAMSADKSLEDITIIAASKTQESEEISKVFEAGITSFGENKAQELIAKADELFLDIDWHFIGQIQTNKLKKIATRVSLIHSIDSVHQIDILAQSETKPIVLIQLSGDGNPERGGVTFDRIEPLLNHAREKDITVSGIMHVPPPDVDPRSFFDQARMVAEKLELSTVSMGMSGDYELAIEHGSTMIRVGTTIFGPRTEQ